MKKRLVDLVRRLIPLSKDAQDSLLAAKDIITENEYREIKRLLRMKKIKMGTSKIGVSPQLSPVQPQFPQFEAKEPEFEGMCQRVSKKIEGKFKEATFAKFSGRAAEIIPKFIGMGIVGMEPVKKACALQLFSKEPFHILLLGDPGTGKTDIIRSAAALHPISSFGLGSGTSGAGLTVTVKGDNVQKGLLAMADKGVCAIDELNLMDPKDRASLYNAMEKGFFTYDKGGKHYKFDARIRVLATANPKGDRFVGSTVETLKQQMPFDPALLTRFHIVFMIRKPNLEQFVEISKRILSGKKKEAGADEAFIKEYVGYCEEQDVELPDRFSSRIIDFIGDIKKNENRYLIEVSPRIVVGITRMVKASARMRMDNQVRESDVSLVVDIIRQSLVV